MKKIMMGINAQAKKEFSLIKKYLKDEIASIKAGKIVSSLSIVSVLILVFTMAFSSIFIFAADGDQVTINGNIYTNWYENGSDGVNHGYIEFGSFPQDEADSDLSSEIAAALLEHPELENHDTGKIEYTNGKEYVKAKLDSETDYHFYEVQPIKWQILNYNQGENKVLLFSTNILENRIFDGYNRNVQWASLNPTSNGGEMPNIRAYLNNYHITSPDRAAYTVLKSIVAEFKYAKSPSGTAFYDRGFLEKAFTKFEREAIAEDNARYSNGYANEQTVGAGYFISGSKDKVRLLTGKEMLTSAYGFSTVATAQGMTTGRIGFVTDYSRLNARNLEPNIDSLGNDSASYWINSRKSSSPNNTQYYTSNGSLVSDELNALNKNGVRPVITLDLSELPQLSGTGTFDNPYRIPDGYKPELYKRMTTWHEDYHGYINFGSFPQDEVSSSLKTEIEAALVANPSILNSETGKITYNGNEYVREEASSGSGYHYYLVKPITWQILDIDTDNNRILVMPKMLLESRNFDSQATTPTQWGALDPSATSGYVPLIRAYLNNYKLSGDVTSYSEIGTNQTFAELDNETPSGASDFYSRGFLEKAFSSSEQEAIVKDNTKFPNTDEKLQGGENIKDTYDKVRLILTKEVIETSYGFNNTLGVGDVISGRLGYLTDYAKLKLSQPSSESYLAQTGFETAPYWLNCVSTAVTPFTLQPINCDGRSTGTNVLATEKMGIRLLMTLDVTKLPELSGSGTINDPFREGSPEEPTPFGMTKWFESGSDGKSHGYINVGTYPRTAVDSATRTKIGQAVLADHSIVDEVSGIVKYDADEDGKKETYLGREHDINYYKIEPIKWQILDILEDKKVLLTTEEVVDNIKFESQNSNGVASMIFWSGLARNGANPQLKPVIRLYLNGYKNNKTVVADKEYKSYLNYMNSSLEFVEHPNWTYENRSFYEKAFTSFEKELIVLSAPSESMITENLDGLAADIPNDKIRLLTYKEVTNPNFGFSSNADDTGYSTNRLAFVNDYSRVLNSDLVSTEAFSEDYLNRMASSYWLYSRAENGYVGAYTVENDGHLTDTKNGYVNGGDGVRPVMVLDLSSLEELEGDGTKENPFTIVSQRGYPIYTDENGNEYWEDDLIKDDLGNIARWNIADTDGNDLWANVFKKKNANGTYKSPEEYLLVFTGTEDEIRLFERVYTGDNEFAYVNDYDRSVATDTVDDSDKNGWKEIGITPWSWLVDASKITSAVVSKECNPNSYSCLFAYLKNLKDIKFETYIGDKRTSTYLRAMFWNCNSLTSIQLPDKLDTSEAEDFAYMFNCCKSLETLDVSNLDTSNACDFTGMFGFCESLDSIDVSNFVTENVETMEFMFTGCTGLTEIIGLENFDVKKVTNFYETFYNTSSLENFDVEDWKPAEDCNLNEMFSFSKVKTINLSKWEAKPISMDWMFDNCFNLESLNLAGWDVTELEYVVDLDAAFSQNENIKEIDITGWDLTKVKDYYEYCGNSSNNNIFYGLDSLELIKVPQTVGDSLIDLNERTYYYAHIDASGNITPITVNGGVSGTEYLYGTDDKTSDDATHPFNCLVNGITLYTDKDGIKYTTDDLVTYDDDEDDQTAEVAARWNISKTGTKNLYANVFKIRNSNNAGDYKTDEYVLVFTGTERDAKEFTSAFVQKGTTNKIVQNVANNHLFNVTKNGSDWKYKEGVTTYIADVTPWTEFIDKDKIKKAVVDKGCNPDNMNFYFAGLSNLNNIAFDNETGDSKNPEKLSNSFAYSGITSYQTESSVDYTDVTDFSSMFLGCENLTSIMKITSCTDKEITLYAMFNGCMRLTNFDISGFNNAKITNISSMFELCEKLQSIDLSGIRFNDMTTMSGMFRKCEALSSITLPSTLDSSNVISYSGMFEGCSALTRLDLSALDFDNATGLENMFAFCENLEDVCIANLDHADNLVRMSLMFLGCKNLKNIYTDKASYDSGEGSLNKIVLSTTNPGLQLNSMFMNCESLENVDFTRGSDLKVESINYMFYGCKNLKDVDISNFEIAINFSPFPAATGELRATLERFEIDPTTIHSINEYNAQDSTFYETEKLETIKVPKSMVCNMTGFTIDPELWGNYNYFNDNGSLQKLYVDQTPKSYETNKLVTRSLSNVKTMNGDPSTLTLLKKVPDYIYIDETDSSNPITYKSEDLVIYDKDKDGTKEAAARWNISKSGTSDLWANVFYKKNSNGQKDTNNYILVITGYETDAKKMSFHDYRHGTGLFVPWTDYDDFGDEKDKIKKAVISKESNPNNYDSYFEELSNLTDVVFEAEEGVYKTPTSMSHMFAGTKISSWTAPNCLDTTQVTDMGYMFNCCTSLTYLDLTNFNTNFAHDGKTSKLTRAYSMFSVCRKLETLIIPNLNTSEVTSMSGMFNNCESLMELNLPSTFTTANVTEMSGMFQNCSSLTSLNLSNFNTSKVTDMNYMFESCSGLTSLTLSSNFVTSNVHEMVAMFYDCKNLISLDLSSFDTSGVWAFFWMLYGCNALTTLDLSGFKMLDLDPYYPADNCICGCNNLNKIILPQELSSDYTGTIDLPGSKKWYLYDSANNSTDYVEQNYLLAASGSKTYLAHEIPIYTDPNGINYYPDDLVQYGSSKLARWNISQDGTKNLYANVFKIRNSNNANDYKTGKYVLVITGNETDAKEYNFYTSGSKPYIPWTNPEDFNTESTKIVKAVVSKESNPDNYDNYFNGLSNLTDVIFEANEGEVKTPITMNYTFMNSGLTSWTAPSSLDVSKVTEMWGLFNGCSSLTSLDLTNFKTYEEDSKTSNLISISAMFQGCEKLTSLKIPNLNTSKAENMSSVFCDCKSLTSITLPSTFTTSKATDLDCMFAGCEKLASLDLSNFNTAKVENMSWMFAECKGLTSLTLPDTFDTSQVEEMIQMFYGCSGLTELNLGSKFNTALVSDFSSMFNGCSSLTALDLSDFDMDITDADDANNFLSGCNSLTKIYLPKSMKSNLDGEISLPKVGKSWYAYDEDNFSDLSAKTVLIPKGAAITGSSKGAKLLSTNAIVGVSDTMWDSVYSLTREYNGSEVDTYHTSVNVGGIDVPVTLTVLFSNKFGDELDVTITPSFTKESDRSIYSFSKDKIVKAKGGKITPKTLTYEAEASNKPYDGKVNTTVKVKTGTTITGIATGENPEITLSGTFADKKAGVDKPVTVTATCDDTHYTIGYPTNEVKASISKKEIHVDGKVPEGASFEDGSKVTVNFTLRQSEKVDGDSLSLSKSSCKGTISGAGQNVTVTVNDSDWPTLEGADSGNYTLKKTTITGNVSEMDLSSASFTLTLKPTEFSYDDGKPLNVEVLSLVVTSPISKSLTEGVDYEISFPDGNWEPGKHSVKIKFIGNYKGTFTRSDQFTIYGHLDKVTMKDRTNKEVNNVYENEYVYFNKKFPSNSDNKIMYSEDDGATWLTMTDENVRFMGDDTILVKQTLDYYYDSQEEELKFHVITVKDVIDSLTDEMNDSDVQTKKKDDIKKILDDERNIDLLFDKDDPDEDDYNDKLSNPKDNNDNVDIASDYLSRNTVPDNLNDDDKKDFVKDLIKEALDTKDFADDITKGTITDFEEAMIKYERLNGALKEVFPSNAKQKLEIDYYSLLESKGHNSKSDVSDGNKLEAFGIVNHLNSSDKKVKLKVLKISDTGRINIMQAALNLNHPDERVIAPYDIKLVNADDEEEVIQPKDSDSVLVKIILPKEYKGKVVKAYHLGDSLDEVQGLVIQKVGNECFVYFDATHFSDYFLTGRDDVNVSIKTSQSGDLTLGRVTPTGFTLKAKGSSHTLTFTSNDLSKGNKVTINVYSYDDVSKSFILDTSKSNIVNMYKQSAFTISNIQRDTYVDVSFSFDESFKEEPKPTPSGGGGGGGGASITIGTLPIDDKGQVIVMHKAYMNGYKDHTFKPQNYISREEVAAIVARCHEQFVEEYNYAIFNDFQDAASRWSKNYIGFCKYKELIHGYEDGSYHPASNMTRAELAVLVNNFLRVQNFEVDEEKLESPAFSDVDGRWYEKDVNKLAAMGILNGYEDGTFKGDQFVTRIEVAIVMNKINGRTVKKDIPDEYIEKVTSAFRDVASNRWFFKVVVEATVSHPADLY